MGGQVGTIRAVPAAPQRKMRKSAHLPESRNKAMSHEKLARANFSVDNELLRRSGKCEDFLMFRCGDAGTARIVPTFSLMLRRCSKAVASEELHKADHRNGEALDPALIVGMGWFILFI